jgi:hypothetical protein
MAASLSIGFQLVGGLDDATLAEIVRQQPYVSRGNVSLVAREELPPRLSLRLIGARERSPVATPASPRHDSGFANGGRN